MKLGVHTAILRDRTLGDALDVIASLGLTGAEINAGGFQPSPHLPVDEIRFLDKAPSQDRAPADAGFPAQGTS